MSLGQAQLASCATDHCITCGDDGVPMTVVHVEERAGLALCVDDEGARSPVETALIDPPSPGDTVLVHAGTAIASLAANAPNRPSPVPPARRSNMALAPTRSKIQGAA